MLKWNWKTIYDTTVQLTADHYNVWRIRLIEDLYGVNYVKIIKSKQNW